MSVKTEVKSLRRICERISHGGDIAPFIGSTKPGYIYVDFYERNRALVDDNSAWDVDEWEAQKMILPFSGRDEFRRVYRLARLLRGRPRSREMLLHWRTYG
ncbi:hypothetical protein DLB95_06760 [Salmonella enterica subsp. diarizonae]|uniref:Uncharacterized protein n=1 Tax=Salmonella diarizonae TaxID=59204 RepID=A0A5Y3W0Z5_SALDZ|nr:hypothetical protein [Salmonella enterica subsp. diarizonae]ECJ4376999.1 hypothetical protein [Salmonella enterica subsp. diarizonae]EEP9439809.1 hypothetical protein [Salmonella enterica subsp. enterica serovar Reading]